MRILFDHPSPFFLAHGGFQTQIEQTKLALEQIGVEVEHLRWWDASQRGDIIHYFGRPSVEFIKQAHGKNCKVVFTELLAGLGARSNASRRVQRITIGLSRVFFPDVLTRRFNWNAFRVADACVALTHWEARLMREVFGAPEQNVHVIPNGVEDVFFNIKTSQRGKWLVCTATIYPLKRVLELAEVAVIARTPVWIIGKPYSEKDLYSQQFVKFANSHRDIVRYEGAIDDRAELAKIYSEARGFVLLSDKESLSLSALEAAATGCPLLLSDLPWARTFFGQKASYCPVNGPQARTSEVLRRFYDFAPNHPLPSKPPTWVGVAEELRSVYLGLQRNSR